MVCILVAVILVVIVIALTLRKKKEAEPQAEAAKGEASSAELVDAVPGRMGTWLNPQTDDEPNHTSDEPKA
jgi:hypothetical protein